MTKNGIANTDDSVAADYQLPAIGTTVQIGPNDSTINGTLIAILIQDGSDDDIRATYQVSWWDGRQRKVEWFEPSEIGFDVKRRVFTIGFNHEP